MLGEFRCDEILGEGGMGQVWRATHVKSARQVAIKVIHADRTLSALSRRAFQREVNAIASLNHRGIVRILDTGEVPADHSFDEGAPWFAMQLARAGSLTLDWIDDFNDLARLLFDVLDALSYAHARGIIHRDIKPDNILLDGTDERGYRPILTDFGIAFTVDSEVNDRAETEDLAGTPSYMAPEQCYGEWRGFGPWTDLYALGCVAWEAACGFEPFAGGSFVAVALKHLSEPLPPLSPRFAVPSGFESWLKRVTQKEPHARFQCAADAAWSLHVLLNESKEWQAAPTLRCPPDAQAEGVLDTLTFSDQTLKLSASQLSRTLHKDRSDVDIFPRMRPPVPGMLTESGSASNQALAGVGLGLFGVRELPLIDRDDERTQLWNALKSCESGMNVTILSGPSGVGKSKLVEWIGTRAQEVGAAHVFVVRHNSASSGAHGLGHAIRTILRASGLQGLALERHLKGALRHVTEDDEQSAEIAMDLAALLSDEVIEGRSPTAFESPAERYELIASVVGLRAQRKPLVIVIENAHVAADSLEFVRHLLREDPGLAIAVYICVDPEYVGSVESEKLDELRASDSVSTLEVSGLSSVYHEPLVQSILPLDRVSASRIALRSKGSPAEMIQMVSELIASGDIVAGDEGYTLHQESRLTGVFEDVWNRSIARLEEHPGSHPDLLVTLEIASALGEEVLTSEWFEVCDRFGVGGAAQDIEIAVEEGLVERIDDGFRLVSSQLANRLRARSIEAGRWRQIHEACATSGFHSSVGTSIHERRAFHYAEAGHDEEAREHWRLAIEDLLATSDYARAAELARKLDDHLAREGVARDDPRRIVAMTHRVDATRFRGRLVEAEEVKDGFEARVANCPDPLARANAYRAFGNLDYLTSNFEKARHWYRLAFKTCPDDAHLLLARMRHGFAWFLSNSPNLKDAIEHYEAAVAEARAAGGQAEEAWALYGIADVHYRLGHTEGEVYAQRAFDLFTKVGSRTGWATAQVTLGDFKRLNGELRAAVDHYETGIQTLVKVGSILESMARSRLAMARLIQGAEDDALDQAIQSLERLEGVMKLPLKAAPLLIAGLLEDDHERALKHVLEGRRIAESSGYVHPDLVVLLERVRQRFG